MIQAKGILTSWTVWFNLLLGGVEIAQAHDLFKLIPEPWGPVVMLVGNILLRYRTAQPVSVVAPYAGKLVEAPPRTPLQ